MIQLSKLNKSYGPLRAVNDLDLEVPAGELFCFLGPNGAGKTSTIKMMTGLVRPDSGTILIDGIDARANPMEARRRLGYIPDTPYLYERLTVVEYLEFVGQLYEVPRAELRARADEYLEIFTLTEKRGALIRNLSHGMRQRVIYAATLLHNPRVLLVDEPFVGLDPHSIRLIKDLLRARTRTGVTIFMTTHILAIAEEIADRIGIIDRGRMAVCGTMAELRGQFQQGSGLEDLFLRLTEQ